MSTRDAEKSGNRFPSYSRERSKRLLLVVRTISTETRRRKNRKGNSGVRVTIPRLKLRHVNKGAHVSEVGRKAIGEALDETLRCAVLIVFDLGRRVRSAGN